MQFHEHWRTDNYARSTKKVTCEKLDIHDDHGKYKLRTLTTDQSMASSSKSLPNAQFNHLQKLSHPSLLMPRSFGPLPLSNRYWPPTEHFHWLARIQKIRATAIWEGGRGQLLPLRGHLPTQLT